MVDLEVIQLDELLSILQTVLIFFNNIFLDNCPAEKLRNVVQQRLFHNMVFEPFRMKHTFLHLFIGIYCFYFLACKCSQDNKPCRMKVLADALFIIRTK